MKTLKVESTYNSAVRSITNVVIEMTEKETDELKSALEVIARYEKAALEALERDPIDYSDWQEVSYTIKANKVIVSITEGMEG